MPETANNPADKVRELQRTLYVCARRGRTRRFHALYDRIYFLYQIVSNALSNEILDRGKTELNQFDGCDSVAQDLRQVREACSKARAFGDWRNQRIHARVRQVADGLALFDWKTGQRLPMSEQECEDWIQEGIWILPMLEGHFASLN